MSDAFNILKSQKVVVPLIVLGAIAILAVFGGPAIMRMFTNTMAGVTATNFPLGKMIAWDPKKDGSPKVYRVGSLTLTLKSVNAANPDTKISVPTPQITVASDDGRTITVNDSDGLGDVGVAFGVGKLDPSNNTPEVIFTTVGGGNGCTASQTKIVELNRNVATGQTEWQVLEFSNASNIWGYPKTRSQSGSLLLEVSDCNFEMEFGSHAGSWTPPRVFTLSNGMLLDVSDSKEDRQVFLRDMAEAKSRCLKRDGDQNGACAGYVADAARLGQFTSAWRVAMANYNPKDRDTLPAVCSTLAKGECPNFPSALLWFLNDKGYITDSERNSLWSPIQFVCGSNFVEYPELFRESPFSTAGKCYRLPMVLVAQWIDEKTALASAGFNTRFLIDFSKPPGQQAMLSSTVVVGEGAFQYQSMEGAMVTVPRVMELAVGQEAAPDPPANANSTVPVEASAPSSPNVTFQPSFDCAKASNTAETLICSDRTLAQLDVELSSIYRQAREAAADPRAVVLDQRDWLARRKDCTNIACIKSLYDKRKIDLERWTHG